MNSSRDPVAMGLISSIRRPGIAKRIELLKELSPRMARVGLVVNPDDPADIEALKASNLDTKALKVAPFRQTQCTSNWWG
jgi:cytochrome c556